MRKSAAPSFRIPMRNIALPSNEADPSSLRSTEAILSLLQKDKNVSDGSVSTNQALASFKKSEDNQPEKVKQGRRCFNIVYGKPSKKKHKTWDGDGKMFFIDDKVINVIDEQEKLIGTLTLPKEKQEMIESGSRYFVGGKEIEVIEEIEDKNIVIGKQEKRSNSSIADDNTQTVVHQSKKLCVSRRNFGLNNTRRNSTFNLAEGAIAMPEPPVEHMLIFNKENLPLRTVYIESWLAKKLRSHQISGITFLYECLMGYRGTHISGAVLADEMGLGKTLQTIALIWTMLRQSPYGGQGSVKRTLIVTPSSLTGNWASEFRKWLGDFRLKPFVVNSSKKDLPHQFHVNERVMIISYDMLIRYAQQIKDLGFDLLVCDEGHRLKNSGCRTNQLLRDLNCEKKLILTGTPLQNDLNEYYVLMDFVNPNILGTQSHFRKYFDEPILCSKQPNCLEEIKELGEERAQELNQIVSEFVLRRTQEILQDFLPPKQELVVFCKPTEIQQRVYNSIIDSLGDITGEQECGLGCGGLGFHLKTISFLRKVSNHPVLFQNTNEYDDVGDDDSDTKIDDLNADENGSGKMIVVAKLLEKVFDSDERIVLVSNSTQTLNLFEQICKRKGYPYARLDGSTNSSARAEIVSTFNNCKDKSQFAFLLSAKAGGVGLNLTAASRLVLFDSDWNPAVDLQAMARIWRDGQRRPVFIYRLLTTGTIEEKIYQRQMSKQGLCNGIVDPLSTRDSVKLSKEELRDLFARLEPAATTDCLTHDALQCKCDRAGEIIERNVQETSKTYQLNKTIKIDELLDWQHFGKPFDTDIMTELKLDSSENCISFIFRNSS